MDLPEAEQIIADYKKRMDEILENATADMNRVAIRLLWVGLVIGFIMGAATMKVVSLL